MRIETVEYKVYKDNELSAEAKEMLLWKVVRELLVELENY